MNDLEREARLTGAFTREEAIRMAESIQAQSIRAHKSGPSMAGGFFRNCLSSNEQMSIRPSDAHFKASTKPMVCRPSKKAARQGVKAANEGVYLDVNDRFCSRRQRRKQNFRPLAGISAVVAFFDGLK